MRDPKKIQNNLLVLFSPEIDSENLEHLRACEYAFKNLSLYFIETTWPAVTNLVRFDDSKLQMMVRRFHRDAYGNRHFVEKLKKLVPDEKTREAIESELDRLSIRINSDRPRKTRIAAAFSLWMSTFRPVYLIGLPSNPISDLWRLEADLNFFLATTYLSLYGTIEVGIDGTKDREIRLERITYDFTFRDINLSSLEMLYCSIFRPILQKDADMTDSEDRITSNIHGM